MCYGYYLAHREPVPGYSIPGGDWPKNTDSLEIPTLSMIYGELLKTKAMFGQTSDQPEAILLAKNIALAWPQHENTYNDFLFAHNDEYLGS